MQIGNKKCIWKTNMKEEEIENTFQEQKQLSACPSFFRVDGGEWRGWSQHGLIYIIRESRALIKWKIQEI